MKYTALIAFSFVALTSCAPVTRISPTLDQNGASDEIIINQKKYRLIDTLDDDGFAYPETYPEQKRENADEKDFAGLRPYSLRTNDNDSLTQLINAPFLGKSRAEAKTSIANARLEGFESLDELIDTLPSCDDMYEVKITRDMGRIEQEQRNVSVDAYIVAVKLEPDQDFHVILGTDEDPTPGDTFMNVEISGVPSNKFANRLVAVRAAFLEEFPVRFGKKYKRFEQAIPVSVSGSLFWDVDHKCGVVGPEWARAQTAWEIHPVTQIYFH